MLEHQLWEADQDWGSVLSRLEIIFNYPFLFLDLVNDEALREDAEKYQNYLKNKVAIDTVDHSKEEVKEDIASISEEVLKDTEVEDSGSDIRMIFYLE